MVYELINPCDEYTFEAERKEVAALTVHSINLMYGAKTESGDEIPLFISEEDAEKWYKETFGKSTSEILNAFWDEVADAFDSYVLGGFRDRDVFKTAMECIPDKQGRRMFYEKWADRATSLNNIGARAKEKAALMRKISWLRRFKYMDKSLIGSNKKNREKRQFSHTRRILRNCRFRADIPKVIRNYTDSLYSK